MFKLKLGNFLKFSAEAKIVHTLDEKDTIEETPKEECIDPRAQIEIYESKIVDLKRKIGVAKDCDFNEILVGDTFYAPFDSEPFFKEYKLDNISDYGFLECYNHYEGLHPIEFRSEDVSTTKNGAIKLSYDSMTYKIKCLRLDIDREKQTLDMFEAKRDELYEKHSDILK